jgi:hypothetical protein
MLLLLLLLLPLVPAPSHTRMCTGRQHT